MQVSFSTFHHKESNPANFTEVAAKKKNEVKYTCKTIGFVLGNFSYRSHLFLSFVLSCRPVTDWCLEQFNRPDTCHSCLYASEHMLQLSPWKAILFIKMKLQWGKKQLQIILDPKYIYLYLHFFKQMIHYELLCHLNRNRFFKNPKIVKCFYKYFKV